MCRLPRSRTISISIKSRIRMHPQLRPPGHLLLFPHPSPRSAFPTTSSVASLHMERNFMVNSEHGLSNAPHIDHCCFIPLIHCPLHHHRHCFVVNLHYYHPVLSYTLLASLSIYRTMSFLRLNKARREEDPTWGSFDWKGNIHNMKGGNTNQVYDN